MPLASLIGQIYARTEPTGNTGVLGGSFSTAAWAGAPGTGTIFPNGNRALSSINGAGTGILRDMGRTVVSSLRTFRKVQLVIPSSMGLLTFGVGGSTGRVPSEEYYSGYIELGFDGQGAPAPVARFGR